MVRLGVGRLNGTKTRSGWMRAVPSTAMVGSKVTPTPPATISTRVGRLLARKSPTSVAPAM